MAKSQHSALTMHSLRHCLRFGGSSKFLFPEGSGAGISTPSASADPLLAGAGTAASAVVGCSRERARAASSALADIAAGSRCYPRDVFAAARPLLLARKEERCVGARSRSTSVHSNNSLCSEIGRLGNPPSWRALPVPAGLALLLFEGPSSGRTFAFFTEVDGSPSFFEGYRRS